MIELLVVKQRVLLNKTLLGQAADYRPLKLTELFSHIDGFGLRDRFNFNDVESDGFRQWTTLTNGHDIPFFDTEARGTVGSNVAMAFFKTSVLLDVMQIITSNNNGVFHFGRQHHTFQNTSTNRHVACKGAFAVNVFAFNRRFRGLESQTNVLVETRSISLANEFFAGQESTFLFLVCFFVLVTDEQMMLIKTVMIRALVSYHLTN